MCIHILLRIFSLFIFLGVYYPAIAAHQIQITWQVANALFLTFLTNGNPWTNRSPWKVFLLAKLQSLKLSIYKSTAPTAIQAMYNELENDCAWFECDLFLLARTCRWCWAYAVGCSDAIVRFAGQPCNFSLV